MITEALQFDISHLILFDFFLQYYVGYSESSASPGKLWNKFINIHEITFWHLDGVALSLEIRLGGRTGMLTIFSLCIHEHGISLH